jgi:Fe-S-cluster containining protein
MDPEIDAGDFGSWLLGAVAVLRGTAGADVPCGSCVGCCVSSYFIPVRPEDAAARARIPPARLVRASRQAADLLMMGYREDGSCPMLSTGQCTIYSDRPQTCRDYDCRIFAAAGIDAGGADKQVINTRVRAWRFRYRDDDERKAHGAVRAAAAFIRDRREAFPGGRAPSAPTGIAVLALKAHAVFLDPANPVRADAEIARAVVEASRVFDTAG